MAAKGEFGQGLFPCLTSPPGEDAKKEVAPLSHAISVVAGFPAGSSKKSPGLGG